MKKLLSLALCLVFALCLTACGDKADGKSSHNVDIEYYAKLGQISDIGYKLGDGADEIKQLLSSSTTDDHGDSLYFDYESGDYTVMSDGNVCCCYITADKDSGITHIIKYGDAYGFTQGTVSTQIRDTMSDMGFDAQERDAKDGELFFLPSSGTLTVLEYGFGDNTVLFVFEQNALSAAVIYTK